MSNLQDLQARAAAAAAALDGNKRSQEEARDSIQRLEGRVASLTGERDDLTTEVQSLKDDNQKLMLEASQAETGRKAAEESAQKSERSLEEVMPSRPLLVAARFISAMALSVRGHKFI